jgi:hypothetical protein
MTLNRVALLLLWALATVLIVIAVKPPVYVQPCRTTASFSSALYSAQASLR